MQHLRYLAIFPILFAAACGSRDDQPLLEKFERDRSQLDRLVTMFTEDAGLARVTMDSTLPEDPADVDVSFDRIAEYRALCKMVEAEGCIEGYDAAYELLAADEATNFPEEKAVIWIHVEDKGETFSGTRKG